MYFSTYYNRRAMVPIDPCMPASQLLITAAAIANPANSENEDTVPKFFPETATGQLNQCVLITSV